MKGIYRMMARKLFGVRYERLTRTLLMDLVVFWGLYMAGVRVRIAPSVLYLMTGSFSAGILWQAFLSEDNRGNVENLFMLPFEDRSVVFGYVAALGCYTLLAKTAGLLAVVLAVSAWGKAEPLGSILCAVHAVLATACVYSRRRGRVWLGMLWAGASLAAIFWLGESPSFWAAVLGSSLLAVLILGNTDAYSFYSETAGGKRHVRQHRHYSVWRYLLRYLMAHKNYLVNTAAMWGVACVLPVFLGQVEGRLAMLVGFAVLSLNTPICILLSCDPALERAVRFLPGQGRTFFVPYGLFVFGCNMAADVIFLCGWQVRLGGVSGRAVWAAALFALAGAAGAALLEWFCPIRGWKIASDLWHHPRKYVVPVALLLAAGAVGMG